MRKTRGDVSLMLFINLSPLPSDYCSQVLFGGSVAYVPQTAWIKNATLRENILFGQNDDQERQVSIPSILS